jgi:hypothetical protein
MNSSDAGHDNTTSMGRATEGCGGSNGRRSDEGRHWSSTTEVRGDRDRGVDARGESAVDSAQYRARWLGFGEGCGQLAECWVDIVLGFQFQFQSNQTARIRCIQFQFQFQIPSSDVYIQTQPK